MWPSLHLTNPNQPRSAGGDGLGRSSGAHYRQSAPRDLNVGNPRDVPLTLSENNAERSSIARHFCSFYVVFRETHFGSEQQNACRELIARQVPIDTLNHQRTQQQQQRNRQLHMLTSRLRKL